MLDRSIYFFFFYYFSLENYTTTKPTFNHDVIPHETACGCHARNRPYVGQLGMATSLSPQSSWFMSQS